MESIHHNPQQQLALPQRPGLSKSFDEKTISLESNIFSLSIAPKQLPIRLYDIKIFDDERNEQVPGDARIQRQDIIREAAKQLKQLFSNNFWYSGEQLWSTNDFKQPKTIEVKLGRAHYTIILTKVKEINLKPETFRDSKLAPLADQYLNILIKRYLKEKDFKEWGMNSKYYDPNKFYHIDQYGLDVYTGFKTSCQVYQGFIPRVVIDFSSKILRSDNVLSSIQKARSDYEIERLLVGKSVITSYGNFRMWRVDRVDFKRTPGTEKTWIGDRQVRLVDYYMDKYKIKIQNASQPLLVNIDRRTRRETLLVPELVQMTGLDDRMRSNFKIMKEVANYTRLEPKQRMEQIQSLNKPLADFFAKEYSITMEQQSSVKGHVLNPPKLLLGNKETLTPEKGNYVLKNKLYMPANIQNWLFIFAEESTEDAEFFVETLQQCSKTFGVKIGKPKMVPLVYETDRTGENLKKTIRAKVEKGTQIVVCMSPRKNSYWYKPFKDVACKELGIITQFLAADSLFKNAMSVCGNILKQMNIKLGKELWITERPKELPAKTMIIGADVFHSTKIGNQKKSCIGFCASLNDDFSQYFSKVTFQNRIGQEIMTNIGLLVKEALQKYYDFNGRKHYPECIIFYRDGVGENQIDACLEIETSKILEELKNAYKDSQFKFAEIIVTKRIDDRLFVSQGQKNYSNPPAGTVVGESIVSNNFDFLMVSQNVNQGTCTPTHYQVIFDNTGLTEDVFWKLTYTQCYNYYNWNGGVRVPAAAQYAHKLAYLMGQTVQGEAHKNLDQYLYYL